ncbi:hypothetical protein ZWY2020_030755 [Hordeum vulgare]|nr:hypothetical protein ZWY2020_030755 [Hordeum vulgare]
MAVARLGGGRGGFFGAVRRLRMRWVAAAYRRALRRLRAFYARALEDLLEGAAAVSSLHSHYAGADCSFDDGGAGIGRGSAERSPGARAAATARLRECRASAGAGAANNGYGIAFRPAR